MKKETLKERIKILRAMDELALIINDEEIIETWLSYGVPDGEIQPNTKDEELIYLVEDEKEWKDLLKTFNWCMYQAYKNGGLWTR